MCLLLLVFPVFMAYKISQFFHMDFWLLILVSSCMLTSLQVGRATFEETIYTTTIIFSVQTDLFIFVNTQRDLGITFVIST